MYKCHRFWIGAATTASSQGMSESQIEAMGRWQSNTYKRYIRIPTLIGVHWKKPDNDAITCAVCYCLGIRCFVWVQTWMGKALGLSLFVIPYLSVGNFMYMLPYYFIQYYMSYVTFHFITVFLIHCVWVGFRGVLSCAVCKSPPIAVSTYFTK